MFSLSDERAIGPLRCAWGPYRHGTPAEALVRPWLVEALGLPADALPLRRDMHGRPRFDPPAADADVSWSHSGERLLVALGHGVQVGADLELLRPRPRALALAERFFVRAETQALAALPAAAQEAAFVRLWCAKEAVLKAHGRGLAFGLHRLEFALRGGDWALVACDPELGAPPDWTLHAFTPMPGYLASLAWRTLPQPP
ncbi:4'-phosphopantetheinyl transferase family protein [Luteimonas mephitis]|uniref:4'-phosphopantetheinyl transferase family protein n=1 Tax=Luteimonas mephitis TaxID=83615 RepID=UPI00047CCC01|nr:4'-phosphopantetheinyl transferase superfamily protein [Luteimonas mephitis]